ncbi:Uncharacterised protein g9789 [Pycnogonum litorale]
MKFCGQDIDGTRMEIMELEGHPYFVGVQYHPEYISRPMKPSPPYLGLIGYSHRVRNFRVTSTAVADCRRNQRHLLTQRLMNIVYFQKFLQN